MGLSCTKLRTIDLNNNGKSDIDELMVAAVELAVERVLARLQQPPLVSNPIQPADVHTEVDSKS
jgi:hypothetical protein